MAVVVFALACCTDAIDGRVARTQGTVSSFGGKLDHLADAFFVSIGLLSASFHGLVPWLLAPFIAIAFTQYLWDSRGQVDRKLRPSFLGRWNGIGYYILLGFAIGQQATEIFLPYLAYVTYWAGWVLVASTIISMVQRFGQKLGSS